MIRFGNEPPAPEGSYRVLVQFVVDIEGNISDIQSVTNFGYGMEEEAGQRSQGVLCQGKAYVFQLAFCLLEGVFPELN